MQEKRKKVILSKRQELMADEFVERAEREGIELEKGAVITNEYLERNYEDLCKWVNFVYCLSRLLFRYNTSS